jgi:phosphatidylserine decarboxylase
MKMRSKSLSVAAALLLAAAPMVMAQNEGQGQGKATVTVLPSDGNVVVAGIPQDAVHVQVDGRDASIARWQSMKGTSAPVELVLMIDNGARASLGRELGDIRHFLGTLPPNVKVTVAWMEYGRAALAGPLTADHNKAASALHLPMGAPGMNASPYFCLSDLAKHWPSNDAAARREVIMITDGVDYYDLRYDPEDPYLLSAITDSVRADLVVYSIYWRSAGRVAQSWYETNAGQNLLSEVTSATGGYSWWMGYGNPVSLTPYFDDFSQRLKNQYELGFLAPLRGKAEVESLKVKIIARDVKTTAPQKTYVTPAGAGSR